MVATEQEDLVGIEHLHRELEKKEGWRETEEVMNEYREGEGTHYLMRRESKEIREEREMNERRMYCSWIVSR